MLRLSLKEQLFLGTFHTCCSSLAQAQVSYCDPSKSSSYKYPHNAHYQNCTNGSPMNKIAARAKNRCTVTSLLQAWASITIITVHRDGGGPLLEITSGRKVCSSNLSIRVSILKC